MYYTPIQLEIKAYFEKKLGRELSVKEVLEIYQNLFFLGRALVRFHGGGQYTVDPAPPSYKNNQNTEVNPLTHRQFDDAESPANHYQNDEAEPHESNLERTLQ